MTDFSVPPPDPETPWEFYPDDDIREAPPIAAEDAAMHIEITPVAPDYQSDDDPPVVHYMDDEDPEIPDLSLPPPDTDSTPEVEDLLIKQHYMSPKEPD